MCEDCDQDYYRYDFPNPARPNRHAPVLEPPSVPTCTTGRSHVEDFSDRFGMTICAVCDAALAYSSSWVKPGVKSDDTAEWAYEEAARLLDVGWRVVLYPD